MTRMFRRHWRNVRRRLICGVQRTAAAADSDKQVIPHRLDLGLYITAEDVRERAHAFRVGRVSREEGRHSRAWEDLLGILQPPQYPIRTQTLACQHEVRCEIFG